ncbi:MAG: peptidoglycan DD-metalloendopeptidase family protein [Calditrichaeota bacterium]|nr:peptidoglycan DD-metalloendopeptidase family protein [Calditrichota bacterium]MCB9368078.1 peptidoglycan DD-metalloendopeptidase family protein [Calditrichota bacterium]
MAKMDSIARVLSALDRDTRELTSQQKTLNDSLRGLEIALIRQTEVAARLDSQYRILEAERQPLLHVLARSVMSDLRLNRWAMLEILLGSASLADFMERRSAINRLRDSAKRRAIETARGLRDIQDLEDRSIDETGALNDRHSQVETILAELAVRKAELETKRELANVERDALLREQRAIDASSKYVKEQLRQKEASIRKVESIVETNINQLAGTTTFASQKGLLPWPISGNVTSRFGKKRHRKLETVTENPGIDLESASGVPVRAVAAGKVATVTWLRGFGNVCIVQHEGDHHTVYARLSEILVQQGDSIDPQTIVGYTGFDAEKNSYGLHFEVWAGKDKQDPLTWLGPAKK